MPSPVSACRWRAGRAPERLFVGGRLAVPCLGVPLLRARQAPQKPFVGGTCAPRFVAVPRYGGHARAGQALPLRLESRSVLGGPSKRSCEFTSSKAESFQQPGCRSEGRRYTFPAALLKAGAKSRGPQSEVRATLLHPPDPWSAPNAGSVEGPPDEPESGLQ